jgi:2-polyprenyl-3-methyl-5-hydroxy-6-metoxy-1,4-benzoquinol methylase
MQSSWSARAQQLRHLWQLPHKLEELCISLERHVTEETDRAVRDHANSEAAIGRENAIAEINIKLDRVQSQAEMLGGHFDRQVSDSIIPRLAEARDLLAQVHDAGARLAAAFDQSQLAMLRMQRTRLHEKFGAMDIITDDPVALDSPDHLVPWGTAHDNSRNERFNARLMSLVPSDRLAVLDLGCSGGGQVRSFIEQGYLAVGVEGSDYSQRSLRAEWATIPDFLFTADITKPFVIQGGGREGAVPFGVVTLWEVIEHIRECDLPAVLRNIDAHLMHGGLVIMSVSPNSDIIDGTELHQNIKPQDWWDDFLYRAGWQNHKGLVEYFGDDFVRGGANAPNSFHYVLSRIQDEPALTRRMVHLCDPARVQLSAINAGIEARTT